MGNIGQMLRRFREAPLFVLWLVTPGVGQEPPASPPQPPPVRLAGSVFDAAGQPVANAAITVEQDGQRVAATRSDASGSFVVGKAPAAAVVVRATTATDAGAVACDLAGLAHGFVSLPVYPARTLRGRVTAAGGAPVAGAFVFASPGETGLAAVDAIATTDADGRYELQHVLCGPQRVRAWSAAHGLCETTAGGVDDATVDCELDDTHGREVAFVLRGATPGQLAAARLRLRAQHRDNAPTRLPPPFAELRPDADGRWLVRGWSTEDRLIGLFEVPGCAVAPPADFAPRASRRWVCTFDVRPEAAIAGVLRDEHGQPLAGRWLFARPLEDQELLGVVTSARTESDGGFRMLPPVGPGERFLIELAPGEHSLVHAEARAARQLARHLARHEAGAVHQLVARSTGVVRARILDGDGRPVRGAMVSLRQSGSEPREVFVLADGAVRQQADSAEDGRVAFRADLREPGALLLEVVAAAGVAIAKEAIGNGVDVDFGDVTLAPAPRIAGIVHDADGRPVPAARVDVLVFSPAFEDFENRVVLTGRDGRFALTLLRAGTCSVWANRGPRDARRAIRFELGAAGRTDLELVAK